MATPLIVALMGRLRASCRGKRKKKRRRRQSRSRTVRCVVVSKLRNDVVVMGNPNSNQARTKKCITSSLQKLLLLRRQHPNNALTVHYQVHVVWKVPNLERINYNDFANQNVRWPQWFLMLVEMEDGQSCIGLACFREPSSIGQFGLIRATPTMKSIGDGYLQKHLEAMYSLRLSSWFGVITDICIQRRTKQFPLGILFTTCTSSSIYHLLTPSCVVSVGPLESTRPTPVSTPLSRQPSIAHVPGALPIP